MPKPNVHSLARDLILSRVADQLAAEKSRRPPATRAQIEAEIEFLSHATPQSYLERATSPYRIGNPDYVGPSVWGNGEALRAAYDRFMNRAHAEDPNFIFKLDSAEHAAQVQHNPTGFHWDPEPLPWFDYFAPYAAMIGVPAGTSITNRMIADGRAAFLAAHGWDIGHESVELGDSGDGIIGEVDVPG